MQLSDLIMGFGLLMIVEGLPLFVSPSRYRRMLEQLKEAPDSVLRGVGLLAMVLGLVVLYAIR